MVAPFTPSEIEQLRVETAGCADDRIFLNHAGASLQPRPVVERVVQHLRLEEQIGGYEAADLMAAEQQAVYGSVARLIHANEDEIALMESATRGWDMAFYSLALKPGDRIVTAQNEYSSNYIALLQRSRQTGAEITVVPASATGEISLSALEQTLNAGGVKLVALTHIATNNGMVQPAAEVGRLTRQFGVPFLLDACQSVGQMTVDVDALGCDMLSAAGRKFLRGPRGTGFLYVRRGLLDSLEPGFLDNHAADWSATDAYTMRNDARRFESFESSTALALGLGAAAEYAIRIGLERIEARVQMLAAGLRERLSRISGIHVTDSGTVRSGIVMFFHDRIPSAELVGRLAARGITVRLGGRFATRLDARLSALDELVRASIHYCNTEGEIERFCEVLAKLVS